MHKKIIWLMVSCLMAISLVLASCGEAEEEEEEEIVTPPGEEEEVVVPPEKEEEEVTPPGGNWWDRWGTPEYGGTFTNRITGDPINFDPYYFPTGGMYLEGNMAFGWMVVPPETWEFRTRYNPIEYLTGVLAESWEIKDGKTITFHIRKGVYWQDKPPVNGREMTADDVEYSWHRMFGLGSGFTEPSPFALTTLYGPPVSVTATDKYTVVYELPGPSLAWTHMILHDCPWDYVVPREVIEEYGGMTDWENVVGTGPFILEDYVHGSSLTYIKNPNYWGYDEQYPENKLPYVDEVKQLIIPDQSTAISALRTGKIDVLGGLSWEVAESIKKTNPELIQDYTATSTLTIAFPVDRKPYSDIKVRKALNMSVDRKTIAETYYGGYVDGTPLGWVYSGYKGYRAEYDDWPQEVKDGYAFNPEGAKQLLAEAGYPEGFKCTITMSLAQDVDLMQILKAYFADIGVEMEIKTFEPGVYTSNIYAGKVDICTSFWGANLPVEPTGNLQQLTSTHMDSAYWHNNDPHFEDLIDRMQASSEVDKYKKLCVEADMYAISQFWGVSVQAIPIFSFTQPWIKRHLPTADVLIGYKLARIWIDHDMKKAMGH